MPEEKIDLSEKAYPKTARWTEAEKIAFLTENKGLIYSFVLPCYSHLSGKDVSLGLEDYMQIAYLAALKAMETYRPDRGCRFTTYAGYLIRRDLKDIRRRIYAEKRTPPEGWEGLEDGPEKEERGALFLCRREENGEQNLFWNPVEEAVLRKDFYDRITEILAGFDLKSRRIFWLLSQKLATQEELAREYHCSQSKVSLDYKAIRRDLKRELSKEEPKRNPKGKAW